jgi:hypothetical protein
MRALVVYESMFGNTRDIALAIADGLSAEVKTDCVEVGSAPTRVPIEVGLVVVGGPTHAFGMSRESTRQDAQKYSSEPLVSAGIGIREWLSRMSADRATAAAAFTTEIARPRLPGSAARGAAKRLRRAGLPIIAEPETFLVEGSTGPITEGELDRAHTWGQRLARSCRELMV